MHHNLEGLSLWEDLLKPLLALPEPSRPDILNQEDLFLYAKKNGEILAKKRILETIQDYAQAFPSIQAID